MQGTVLLPIYLYTCVSVIYNQIIESGWQILAPQFLNLVLRL